MKIQEIDIKNFRGYGENPDEEDGFFKFKDLDKPDIVLITGHNGYGKTSIYEAIEWCLTNDIKALRKRTENVNYKNTLKKSHYLKFQGVYDDEERRNARVVQVQIVFDNGKTLLRTSNCYSLHQDHYASTIVNEAGRTMEETEKDEVKEFIKENAGQEVDIFFRLNFCGQAYSEDLVRDTAAKDRGGIWLSFLGMNAIDKIITNSDARQNTLLRKKETDIQRAITEGNVSKYKVNTIFQTNNWGSIETYHSLLSEKIKSLNEFQKELQEINIVHGIEFKDETIADIVETLKKANVLKERMEQAYNEDMQQKRLCIKERLIKEFNKNQSMLKKLEMISNVDIVKLQQEVEQYSKDKGHYQTTVTELENKELETRNSTIQQQEDSGEIFFLTKTLINKYERERVLYRRLYSQSQEYGLVQKEEKVFLDTKRLLRYSEQYYNNIDTGNIRLEEKKQALQMMDGLCSSQKEMLLKVQTFVNQKEKIEQCPVCKSKDFFAEGEVPKDKLLSIIENEISDGSESIKKYNSDIVALETCIARWKDSYTKEVWEKFTLGSKNLQKAINECIQAISEYLHEMKACNSRMLESVQLKCSNLQKKIGTYHEFELEYGDGNASLEDKKSHVKEINQKLETILAEKFQVQIDEKEQFTKGVQGKIRPLIRRTYLEQRGIDFLNDILQYNIEQENLELLEKYEENSSNADKLNEKKELYQGALNFRSRVNEIAKTIQREMTDRYVKDNKMINVIYQFINPHPFYRGIGIESGSETNIKSSAGNDIFLDHVFSEAQMKILSLSIFLGLNLSVKNSCFEQIYIDDPVQSMDDINMISFIDLLRAIKVSKSIDKNFVIGTHDDNFSKLVKIKFRHHSFIEYHFDAYLKEGPKVSCFRNGLAE